MYNVNDKIRITKGSLVGYRGTIIEMDDVQNSYVVKFSPVDNKHLNIIIKEREMIIADEFFTLV